MDLLASPSGLTAAAGCALLAGAALLAGSQPRWAAQQDATGAGRATSYGAYVAAADRAQLRRGCERGRYLALVKARPSVSPPRWAPEGCSALQLAQRRLAFGCSQLASAGADGAPYFWRGRLSPLSGLSSDVVELVGRALAAVVYAPAPLRFAASCAAAGYDVDGEGGALARAIGSLAAQTGRLGDPKLRVALCAESPMGGGRSSAAFTVARMGRWSGVHVGVARAPAAGAGESPFWGLHSGTGWLDHEGSFTEWDGMEPFGQGDVVELLLDGEAGALLVKKNGRLLGELPRGANVPGGLPYGSAPLPGEPLCWGVALHHRDDAVRVVRTDPAQFCVAPQPALE